VCVGEWSGRQWSSVAYIHWRLVASSLVIGQRRSRVSRWLCLPSRSTAEQWTTTTTRPHWHKLSSQALATNTIMLQRTRITTLRYAPQQWAAVILVVIVVIWRHLSVSSVMSSVCESSLLTTLTYSTLIGWKHSFMSHLSHITEHTVTLMSVARLGSVAHWTSNDTCLSRLLLNVVRSCLFHQSGVVRSIVW